MMNKNIVGDNNEASMTQKRKPKPNGVVDQFFNTILFVQRYTFETSLPLYMVMNRLHELSDEKHGWLNKKSRYVVESEDRYDHHNFDIRAKDRQLRYTITHATGIVDPQDSGGVVIEGEIRFGVVYLFLLILSVLSTLFIFQYFGLYFPLWVLGLSMLTPTFTFVHMFYKRRQLIQKIKSAIIPTIADNLISQKRRKGLHEIYAELGHDVDYLADEPVEQANYDQQ
jgi:hypothetical protein